MGMTLIETIEVGSGGAASMEFTGIAGTGQDLLCVFSARSDNTAVVSNTRLYFNGQTGGTYPIIYLTGNGSSITAGATSFSFAGRMNGAASTANTFTSAQVYIPNYASSGDIISSIESAAENNATEGLLFMGVQNETTGGPLTSIKIQTSGADTLQQYSTASLYMITAD